jgi:hypothetical protein
VIADLFERVERRHAGESGRIELSALAVTSKGSENLFLSISTPVFASSTLGSAPTLLTNQSGMGRVLEFRPRDAARTQR